VTAPSNPPRSAMSTPIALAVTTAAFAAIVAVISLVSGGGDDSSSPEQSPTSTATPAPATSASLPDTSASTSAPASTAPDGPQPVGADLAELATATVRIVRISSSGEPTCWGSGSTTDPSGIILTNAHVVRSSEECPAEKLRIDITHRTDALPEPTYYATVAGYDPVLDLATVRITTDLDGNPVSPTSLPFMLIGDSEEVDVGDTISAVGYPGIGGDTISVTTGIVSGFSREAGVDAIRAWIKTDATIAGGNSGGAAVDTQGRLIGIPTQTGANASADIVDCRNLADTNRDGVIDDLDSCVPIGGFINGLRPVNLAADLLQAARDGAVDESWKSPPFIDPVSVLDTATAFNFAFSLGVNDDNTPRDIVYQVPSSSVLTVPSDVGTICTFWDYEGMVNGARWAAVWLIDGEVDESSSLFDLSWDGGQSGNWWTCLSAEDGIGSHVVEYQFMVEDTVISSDAIYTGDDHVPVTVRISNRSATDVCSIQETPTSAANWGQDDLWNDSIPLGPDTWIEIPVTTGDWDFRLLDCNGDELETYFGLSIEADSEIEYPNIGG